ncbi:ATP-binding protein [Thermodesulfobacteriota bacterium]
MMDSRPLYNSRLTKTYLEYLKSHYPNIDIESVLKYAGITRHEVQDPAHWFTQMQVDRFQEILVGKTANPNIAREAGRFTVSSEGLGPARQQILGFMKPMPVYLFMEKLYPILSRGATIKSKKTGSNRVEIISIPTAEANEKPYQCDNRIGVFESLAKFFTDSFATVEHPFCLHRGDECCRYVVTWKKTPALIWKLLRNYSLLLGTLLSIGLYPILSFTVWSFSVITAVFLVMSFSFCAALHEKNELSRTIKKQGDAAKDLLDEMHIRHNNAMLVQEIGRTSSTILDVERLVRQVMNTMATHIDFDRGMILLANQDKSRLIFRTGYGYDSEKESILQKTEFNLTNPESKGVFVTAFREKKPFLINDITKIEKSLSPRSLYFAREMGVKALVCVPIVYEEESLGLLVVDNLVSKRPLAQSDMSFLSGIASQTAISIINARTFQKIQVSEIKYRELVENANSIIMRRDIDGKITFFNEFAQQFFGYTESEIIGKNVCGTILPQTVSTQRELDALIASFQTAPDRPVVNESENILRSGEQVWIAWTYKPIFMKRGKFKEILCIGNDITELKRSEIDKRELEIQLIRAQKMEAIGTLAGGVAHDLNNILSGIVSYPELLLMDIPADSPLKNPLLTIQKSGMKAATIVQDLLTMARRGVAFTDVVNLNHIVSDYLKSPEHEKLMLCHSKIQIETHIEINLLNIFGSSIHLSKTLMNLVYNAAEASPDGGKIIITTCNQYIDKPVRKYESVREGDYVKLTVSDSGTGIPQKDIGRIFEPFYSNKIMGRSGTGLGLAIIWGTVKDHNGYIDVKSTEGKGTQITLYFPVTRQSLSGHEPPLSDQEFMGNGESILVVDDVDDQRDIATEVLKKLNYVVTSVSSGEDALIYLRAHTVDLLVLDMIMEPGMDGLETYKKIT